MIILPMEILIKDIKWNATDLKHVVMRSIQEVLEDFKGELAIMT